MDLLYGYTPETNGFRISKKRGTIMSKYFEVTKERELKAGIWFDSSYWDTGTDIAYSVKNNDSSPRKITSILATMLPGNTGGEVITIRSSQGGSIIGYYGPTNGSGCKMMCKIYSDIELTTKLTDSYYVDIPSQTKSNITGNTDDNYECWFTPRPGPKYKFQLKSAVIVQPGASVVVTFYATDWKIWGTQTIQISSQDTIDVPDVSTYTVTLKTSSGVSSVTGAGSYESGQSVTVSAELEDEYTFKYWIKSGKIVSTNLKYSFSMPDEDITLTAVAEAVPEPPSSYIYVYKGTTEGWVREKVAYTYKGGAWTKL